MFVIVEILMENWVNVCMDKKKVIIICFNQFELVSDEL